MKHFLPVIVLLVVAAPIVAEERFYYFDSQVIQETYENLLCQANPDVIQSLLKSDEKLPQGDPYKMLAVDRNILQQCLPRLRNGERFDFSKKLRTQLMNGLRLIKKDCPKNLKPLSLDSKTADECYKQLKSRGFFEEKLRNELLVGFDVARRIPPCGTVWKSSGRRLSPPENRSPVSSIGVHMDTFIACIARRETHAYRHRNSAGPL